MLLVYSRLGVIDLAGTVVLTALHAALGIAYIHPRLARGVYAPLPGRVSVVSYIDDLALPGWQVGFCVTAALLLLALYWTRWLPTAHGLAAGVMSIYVAALWFGFALSEQRPSIVTALGFTAVTLWHVVLAVTYSVALSLPEKRAGGRRREGPAR